MILWHFNIVPLLPGNLLSALHRDLCHARGGAWGAEKTFGMAIPQIGHYHFLVVEEMVSRGWKPNLLWCDTLYRGKKIIKYPKWFIGHVCCDSGQTFLNGHPRMTPHQFKLDLATLKQWEKEHDRHN